MHRSEPSRLQSLALQLADKVNNFVDSNERIFEMKLGKLKTLKNPYLSDISMRLLYLSFIFSLGKFFPRGGNQNQGNYGQTFGRQGGGGHGGHGRYGSHGGHSGHGGQDWNRQRRDNRNNY